MAGLCGSGPSSSDPLLIQQVNTVRREQTRVLNENGLCACFFALLSVHAVNEQLQDSLM